MCFVPDMFTIICFPHLLGVRVILSWGDLSADSTNPSDEQVVLEWTNERYDLTHGVSQQYRIFRICGQRTGAQQMRVHAGECVCVQVGRRCGCLHRCMQSVRAYARVCMCAQVCWVHAGAQAYR